MMLLYYFHMFINIENGVKILVHSPQYPSYKVNKVSWMIYIFEVTYNNVPHK